MGHYWLLATALLAHPAMAHPVYPDCTCPAHRCETAPIPPSEWLGVLEVSLGLSTRFVGVHQAGDTLEARAQDTAPLLSLTPGLEWELGRILYVGADVAFLSVDDPTSAGGRRSVTVPGVRARSVRSSLRTSCDRSSSLAPVVARFVRMSFGVADHLVADAVFGAGVALWSSEGGPSLIGWSRRMSFGGAYEVTEGLWAFTHLGSLVVEAGAAGKGPLSGEFAGTRRLRSRAGRDESAQAQPVGAAAFTWTLGVRSLL